MGSVFMKNNLKVACASLNQTPLDWSGNFSRIVEAITEAKQEDVDLLVFSELALTAYTCEDYFFWPEVVERAKEQLLGLRLYCSEISIVVGLPWSITAKDGTSSLYNCAAVIEDGKILGIRAKKTLADKGVYYEPRWFKAWKNATQTQVAFGDQHSTKVPFGDLCFAMKKNYHLGVQICEEAWQGTLSEDLQKVDVLACLNASHFEMGKVHRRLRIIEKRSAETKALYVYCNTLGLESGRLVFGGDQVYSHQGRVLQVADRLGFEQVKLSTLSWDSSSSLASSGPKKRDLGNFLHSDSHLYQEFTQAVCLALYDYLRKSHQQNYVISLSGGLDSAVCAILVRLMQIFSQSNCKLYCLYQKTAQSSFKTESAAKKIAMKLKADFKSVDIDPIVDSYQILNKSILGKALSFDKSGGVSLQNLQARARSILPWTVANENKAILITTSNRSESVVGYCTMDGDTAGGLAPVAGVSKFFLRQWALWLCEQDMATDFAPELRAILSFKPTAELKPAHTNQEDEKELMPYEVLDFLEKLFFQRRIKSKTVLHEALKKQFDSYTFDQHLTWVNLFIDRWQQNQWKRERIAPSFHLDRISVDPKGWCRTPILTGSSHSRSVTNNY